MKKLMAIIAFIYCGLIAVICILGIGKATYEIFMGGISNVFAADWLLVEIPYVFVYICWFFHIIEKAYKDPIHRTLNYDYD